MKSNRKAYFCGVKLVLMAHIIALRVFMFVQARYPPIIAVFCCKATNYTLLSPGVLTVVSL